MKCMVHLEIAVLLFGGVFLCAQTAPPPAEQELQSPAASSDQKDPKSAPGSIEVLSDTRGVDFNPYLRDVLQRVRNNWYALVPDSARSGFRKGKVTIQFTILKDGKVNGMTLAEGSGDVALDRAAWGGIMGSNPFPALPGEFMGPYIALRFHFYYNLDKGDVAASQSKSGAADTSPHGSANLAVGGSAWVINTVPSAGTQTQSGVSRDLFRMERAQPGGAVCVLVREDGGYRLEKVLQAKTEMYTGALDSAGVEQLQALLANEELRKLSQSDIHKPLITDTFDNVQLAIWRGQSWQELLFVSPSSRKSYKESLDPLLRWFKDLQKRPPAATQVGGTPTRCKPAPTMQIAVHVETSESTKPSTAAGGRAPYLFRVRSSHYYNARAESTCTIVFGDGSYHWEQSNQAFGANRQDRTIDGQLQPPSLHELEQILTASDLAKSTGNPEVKNLPVFQEGTITVLSVPRDTQVQNLIFATVFNTKGGWLEIGGKNNLRYRITDHKVLEPLKKWMKDNSDAHDKAAEKTAPGNDCTASKSVGESNSN